MRTLSQPQQIKGNVWDVSTKDFVCFRPGNGLMPGAIPDKSHPIVDQLEQLDVFAGGKSFKFKNSIVGPTPRNHYLDNAALMPNTSNPSDHMMVIRVVPLQPSGEAPKLAAGGGETSSSSSKPTPGAGQRKPSEKKSAATIDYCDPKGRSPELPEEAARRNSAEFIDSINRPAEAGQAGSPRLKPIAKQPEAVSEQ